MADTTSQMQAPRQPALRNAPDREMIPMALIRAMFGLALASVAIVAFAVWTGREPVGQPKPAEVVAQMDLVLIGGGAKAVTVARPDGTVLADMAHGGFITVIQNGLQTARRRHGIDPTLPVQLVDYANGRLAIHDPVTGWSVELHAFGGDNEAAFRRLMSTN